MKQEDLIITDHGTFAKLNVNLFKHRDRNLPAHLVKFFNEPLRISRKRIELNANGGYIDPEINTDGVEIDPSAIIGTVDLSKLSNERTKLKFPQFATVIGPGVIICDDVELHGRHGYIQGPVFIGEGSKIYGGVRTGSGVFIGERNSMNLGKFSEIDLCQKQIGIHCIIGNDNNFIMGTDIGRGTMLGSDNFVEDSVSLGDFNVIGDNCTFDEGVALAAKSVVESGSLVSRNNSRGSKKSWRLSRDTPYEHECD